MTTNEKALQMHEQWNGKLEISAKAKVNSREDLAIAYTPGVAEPCKVIAQDQEAAYKYTMKPIRSLLSRMEVLFSVSEISALMQQCLLWKESVLFKEFGGVNAVPICLDTQDTEEIIRTIVNIAPAFGGINLEDILCSEMFELRSV